MADPAGPVIPAPTFSIVIPTWNSSATLAETLGSIEVQSFGDWEAIIVDDGSTDDTVELARAFAEREPRARVVEVEHRGQGAARTSGVELARGGWIVFLDSDDWLLPTALARFADGIAADPDADVVYGNWSRVAIDGTTIPNPTVPAPAEMRAALATYCPLAIHSAAVRRERVLEVGGFDPSIPVCEDWDLWLRIAERGAKWARVDAVVAHYRMRPVSAVVQPRALLEHGLAILGRGVTDDRAAAAAQRVLFSVWPAAMVIGMDQDPAVMLGLQAERAPDLSPKELAGMVFLAVLIPSGSPPTAWRDHWERWSPGISTFLESLEAESGTPDLRIRTERALERCVIDAIRLEAEPIRIGHTLALALELTRPISDVTPEPDVDRVRFALLVHGELQGWLELPVCDGAVATTVIIDAIAADHGWQLLGKYFARTVYREVRELEDTPGTLTRNGVVLGRIDGPLDAAASSLHDAIGWIVFLQELWGKRDWPLHRFYHRAIPLEASPDEGVLGAPASVDTVHVEVGERIGGLRLQQPSVRVEFAIGGAPVALVRLPTVRGRVSIAALIGACTGQGGMELTRIVAREALIGRPLTGGTLRQRLARRSLSDARRLPLMAPLGGGELLMLAPRWHSALTFAPPLSEAPIILTRRRVGAPGTSAARRATLPLAAAPELLALAEQDGDPVVRPARAPTGVEYRPGLFWPGAGSVEDVGEPRTAPRRDEERGSGRASWRLPILRFRGSGPNVVSAEWLERLVTELTGAGYHGVGLGDWRRAKDRWAPLPGRPILLTFDGAEFEPGAEWWPKLVDHGLAPIVFVASRSLEPTGGGLAVDLRALRAAGVGFGSLGVSGSHLTALDPAEVVKEAARSRLVMQDVLGEPIAAFAYPHGSEDPAIQHLIGGSGYLYGLSLRPGPAELGDPLLAIRRIEAGPADDPARLVASLGR